MTRPTRAHAACDIELNGAVVDERCGHGPRPSNARRKTERAARPVVQHARAEDQLGSHLAVVDACRVETNDAFVGHAPHRRQHRRAEARVAAQPQFGVVQVARQEPVGAAFEQERCRLGRRARYQQVRVVDQQGARVGPAIGLQRPREFRIALGIHPPAVDQPPRNAASIASPAGGADECAWGVEQAVRSAIETRALVRPGIARAGLDVNRAPILRPRLRRQFRCAPGNRAFDPEFHMRRQVRDQTIGGSHQPECGIGGHAAAHQNSRVAGAHSPLEHPPHQFESTALEEERPLGIDLARGLHEHRRCTPDFDSRPCLDEDRALVHQAALDGTPVALIQPHVDDAIDPVGQRSFEYSQVTPHLLMADVRCGLQPDHAVIDDACRHRQPRQVVGEVAFHPENRPGQVVG